MVPDEAHPNSYLLVEKLQLEVAQLRGVEKELMET
jgi:hypothetical protein